MSAEKNKALVRRWFEGWNNGKAAAIAATDEVCATNIAWVSSTGKETHGIRDFEQSISDLYDAFPDAQFIIDDMVAEGDKIAVRWTCTYTHKGAFMGIPPTNKKLTIWAIEIYRIGDGKIVEGWARTDTLGMMQQLGLIPPPKK